jgi:hypothetical protein
MNSITQFEMDSGAQYRRGADCGGSTRKYFRTDAVGESLSNLWQNIIGRASGPMAL